MVAGIYAINPTVSLLGRVVEIATNVGKSGTIWPMNGCPINRKAAA